MVKRGMEGREEDDGYKVVEEQEDQDLCIRCGGKMVHIGFQIYRCQVCGHQEKPEDII